MIGWKDEGGKRVQQPFYLGSDLDQAKAYAYAIEVMAAAATTPAAQEGIAAFLGKRKPAFPD